MNKKHFLLYWMQNFSSFISYTGFLTPFKVKTWFFYSINARYYLWEENNNAKMSRSIKILDVPKTFQFSFFFTPVCVYFQKISMARNAIFLLFKCWILKLCNRFTKVNRMVTALSIFTVFLSFSEPQYLAYDQSYS